jgi:RNA recognition motif-containing protein
MGNKVYVGNMNYDTSEDTLRDLFKEYGEVKSVRIITDRFTGFSKGFGFVEMSTDEEASSAITGLDGKEVDGRNIRVSEARSKPRRDSRRY